MSKRTNLPNREQNPQDEQHRSRRARFLALSAPCVASVVMMLTGCKTEPSQPFDPVALQQNERNSSRESLTAPMRPLPTTLESQFLTNQRGTAATRPTTPPTTGPALGIEPTVRMPLREIVQRAVMNNLDVKVAGYDPAIEGTRVVEAQARFDPTFFSNFTFENRDKAVAFQTVTSSNGEDAQRIYTLQTGIKQLTESGAQFELRMQTAHTTITGAPRNNGGAISGVTPNPFIENDLVLQVTQPLLRDFGNEINRARIVVNRNNQRISLLDFRKQLEQTALEIEKTYWQLAQSRRDVEVNEVLLQQTFDTAELLFRRVSQDVTRVQLSQANTSVEQRRTTLIRAKARVRDLSDHLKRLMNDPEFPVAGPTLILPADDPMEVPVHFDLKDQVDTALENRFELGQQQIRQNSAEVTVGVAKNNLLPQFNIVGQADVQGLDSEFGPAFDNQWDLDHISWSAGFQFEIPIGNRAARAVLRRSMLQRQQSVDQYRSLVAVITEDVKTKHREVETTWQEMVGDRRARFAAEDELLAFNQRREANEPLTPDFVRLQLDSQERLAQARQTENDAIARYNINIANLEQAKGTLLRYNNVVMEETKLPIAK